MYVSFHLILKQIDLTFGEIQSWASQKLNTLSDDSQTKYKLAAKILNRPMGLIHDEESRLLVKADLLKSVGRSLQALESTCGVVFLCYCVDLNGRGVQHRVFSSDRLQSLQMEQARNGVIEDIISLKHFRVPRKELSVSQRYTQVLNDLVSKSKFYWRLTTRRRNHWMGQDELESLRQWRCLV